MKKRKLLRSLLLLGIAGLILLGCKKDDKTKITTGTFTYGTDKYDGMCMATASLDCSGQTNVAIVHNNGTNSLLVYNMPSASSGTFTIKSGWQYASTCELYVLGTLSTTSAYAAVSGTVTKTGARSYTVSVNVSTSPSYTNTIKVTGSGNY